MNKPGEPSDGAHPVIEGDAVAFTEIHTRWPAAAFYWSILDAPAVPVTSLRPPTAPAAALDLLLASDLPLPVDEVHAVYRRLDGKRVLACAAPTTSLQSLPRDSLSLSPTGWPEVIEAECVDLSPSDFNLLVGAFEPRPVRRARATRALWASGCVLLIGALAAIGFERRASAWTLDAAAARTASDEVLLAAFPDEPPASTVRPLRLKAELEQLRRTRGPEHINDAPADSAVALSHLLASWPADRLADTQVVSVSESALSMNVRVDGDPQELLEGLSPVPGWVREEPRVSRAGDRVLLTLSYRPETPR